LNPKRIEAAMSEAQQAIAMLPDADAQARFQHLCATETDVVVVLDRLAEQSIADRLLAEMAMGRARRLEERGDVARDLIRRMLEALEIDKLERPTWTATVAEGPKAVIVEDENLVPQEFLRSSIDKNAIKRALKAGEDVPGAVLTNGMPVLRLLTR